jgi:hypothetical protein
LGPLLIQAGCGDVRPARESRLEGRSPLAVFRCPAGLSDAHRERLSVAIQEEVAQATTLVATLTGERRPLTDAQLLRAVLRLPLMTYKVTVGIHHEALRLWLKGVPLQPRAAGGHDSLTKKLGPQPDLPATE